MNWIIIISENTKTLELSFPCWEEAPAPPERCRSYLRRGRQLGTRLLAQERREARLCCSYGPCLVGAVSWPRRTDASQSCDYYAVFTRCLPSSCTEVKVFNLEVVQTLQKSACVCPKLGLQHCVTDLRQIALKIAPKTNQLSSPHLCLNAPFQVCLVTSPTSAEPFSSIRISRYRFFLLFEMNSCGIAMAKLGEPTAGHPSLLVVSVFATRKLC